MPGRTNNIMVHGDAMDRIAAITQAIDDALSRKEIAIPIPHGIAGNLSSLLSREDIQFSELARIIEKDPSLTAKLLNLANSSFYSGIVRAKTIEQAVSRIGLVGVKNLLMTIIFKEVFTAKTKYLSAEIQLNWRHSLACGVCGKKIAEKAGRLFLAQDAYLLGLLHDLGVVAILNILSALYKEDEALQLNTPELIDLLYGMHASAGAIVLRRLNFNEKLCCMVEQHHTPQQYSPQDETLLHILVVADALLKKTGLSLKPDTAFPLTDLPSVQQLHIDEPLLMSLAEEIPASTTDIERML